MLGVKIDYHMSAWKKTLIAGLISSNFAVAKLLIYS